MPSIIESLRDSLSAKHYVRKASTENYWFDFSVNQMAKYVETTRETFCLVVNGSTEEDNCYIVPYKAASQLFQKADADDRGRWVGTILNDVMKIHSTGLALEVSNYYNRHDLLQLDDGTAESSEAFQLTESQEMDEVVLIKLVQELNIEYKNAQPEKKIYISERAARPGAISTALKKIHKFTCQICKLPGFKKKSGTLFCEAHHIIELHNLIAGSHCSENIIVVCANCHRKLHYAHLEFQNVTAGSFKIKLNDDPWVEISRNVSDFSK